MRMILVPVADRPECIDALQASFWLARRMGASVTGFHVRPHADSEVKLPADILGSEDASWKEAYQHKYSKDSHHAAKEVFAAIAAKHDYELGSKPSLKVKAYWQEKLGSPERMMAIYAPVSDLVVVSRPSRIGGSVARTFMNSAINTACRPVLVLPKRKTKNFGKSICIAWNQSAEATRAVAAAMPMLRRAEAVTIITCGPESMLGPKAGQLRHYLEHWGVKSEQVRFRHDNIADQHIYETYQDTGADLLVMGAYSRSRMREQIFGGVTDFMLNKASKAAVLVHA